MVIQTSDLDDHIKLLAMQLKDAEDKLRALFAAGTSPFPAAIVPMTPSPTLTPNLTPTPFSTRIVPVDADPSPSTTVADVASVALPVGSNSSHNAIEYIDAAYANDYIMYHQHLHTKHYIVSIIEEVESINETILEEPYISRWPKD
jgi:hypothetical protein